MRKNFYILLAALTAIVIFSGCVCNKPLLKTENLCRDEVSCNPEGIADYDALVFKSHGAEIYGQILKPDQSFGANRPCVIFFHGFAGFARFDDIAQALCRSGCVVLIVHHRGAWGSQGKYSITNCIQDAAGLIKHVKTAEFTGKYRTNADFVYLVGHSMGGNTALNAAAQTPGVKGIVLLAPCDIGTMTKQMTKSGMRTFLIDNGLEVLKTDGFEAVYNDLAGNASRYSFPNAAAKLKNTSVLLITGQLDTCISNDLLMTFYNAVTRNKTVPVSQYKSYKSKHGLMGVRVKISGDIADFILQTAK